MTVLDAYRRSVVHWEVLTTMTAADVRRVVQQALETTQATPKLVTDTGSQFTSARRSTIVVTRPGVSRRGRPS